MRLFLRGLDGRSFAATNEPRRISAKGPRIALNRWRAYDPLLGAFLQPDPADQHGRTDPEGYLYGLGNLVMAVDPSGNDSIRSLEYFDDLGPGNTSRCDWFDKMRLEAAAALAYKIVSTCHKGYCGGDGSGQRKWLNAIYSGVARCPKAYNRRGRFLLGGIDWIRYRVGNFTYIDPVNALTYPIDSGYVTDYYPRTIDSFFNATEGPECLAGVMAHERLHSVLRRSIDLADFMFAPHLPLSLDYDLEEDLIHETIDARYSGCFKCTKIMGLDFGSPSKKSGLF